VVRSDPNRNVIPAFIVDAVVHEPWGAHPSYVQGYYDRDNAFYVEWENVSRDATRLQQYLDDYVYGVRDRGEYARKLSLEHLRADQRVSAGVNYGF
jgi:glutaconate CoA-transferase subunit A